MPITSRVAVPVTGVQQGVRCEKVGFMIGEAERLGSLPVILCQVRMTSKGIRGFVRVCERLNVQVRPAGAGDVDVSLPTVENVTGACAAFGSEVFECVGKLADLEYLAGHPSVTDWGYVDRTAKRVGFTCAGAGPEKVRTMKKFRDPAVTDWTKTSNAVQENRTQGKSESTGPLLDAMATNKGE